MKNTNQLYPCTSGIPCKWALVCPKLNNRQKEVAKSGMALEIGIAEEALMKEKGYVRIGERWILVLDTSLVSVPPTNCP